MSSYWENTLERRLSRRGFLALMAAAGVSGSLVACSGDDSDTNDAVANDSTSVNIIRPDGWVEATHGNVDPDFSTVFPSGAVNQLKLTIGAKDWQAMLDNITELFGPRGIARGQSVLVPVPVAPAPGQQDGAGDTGSSPSGKPMWIAGEVSFKGQVWTKVGIRFKGNSSLKTSWGTGSDRLPFKLDFDQWEGDFPEIRNQRFYGFKQLSLSNNVGDLTSMRESLAYAVFDASGLPSARTGFYEVILDRGEGEMSLGIYTAIEVVDDTLVERYFGDDSGNIYEVDGPAASLGAGLGARLKNSFQKENNVDEADWSDIEELHKRLHASARVTDQVTWRRNLEAVFNVPVFLQFVAISAALQHWDTYGAMNHNYYLYNHEGRLNWISWDHNLILGATLRGDGNVQTQQDQQNRDGNLGGRMNISLDKKDVTANWPLIRYLMDMPIYYEAYKKYLKEAIDGPFNATKAQARYEAWAKILQPYADKRNQTDTFQAALQSLIQTTKERNQLVSNFLTT